MSWLLTGGAGYIGAHIAGVLRDAGMDVVVIDDLSTGVATKLPPDVPLVEASVLDTEVLRATMRDHDVRGVVHLAAKKAVGESVEKPLLYYRENIGGMESLLRAMVAEGVRSIVFSSSSAVYGSPDLPFVTEATAPHPMSPYGETKLICEWMLRDTATAHDISWISLRYFNPVGCASPALGDTSVGNLVPMTFKALVEGRKPQVYGGDWPTRDGTCIRDYIHVVDLAAGHVTAAQRLEQQKCGDVYNVGRGEGVTVKEVLDVVRDVTGIDVGYDVVGRRPGDPAAYFADSAAIERDLGWKAERDLADMVTSAWAAWDTKGLTQTSGR